MNAIPRKIFLNGRSSGLFYNLRPFASLQAYIPKDVNLSILRSTQEIRRLHTIPLTASILKQKWPVFFQSSCSKSTSDEEKPKKKKILKSQEFPLISWKNLCGVSLVGLAIYGVLFYLKTQRQKVYDKEKRQVIGKADIGGSFQLFDHDNNSFDSDDYIGSWILIYFGFTHCPDICPDELEKIAAVVDILDKEDKLFIQPLFVTVDPKRDSAAAIKKYLSEFHPKFLGLTGTNEMIAKVCKQYRVYFSEGPKDQDNDYIVDHTIVSYLMDPLGNFVDYYGQNTSAEQIAAKIKSCMGKFKPKV